MGIWQKGRVVCVQVLEVHVRDSHLTGRADLGYIKFPLRSIPPDGHVTAWVPVQVRYPPSSSFSSL